MKRPGIIRIFAFFLICFVLYALVEPYMLEVKEYEIASPQIPQAFDGASLAYLSDFHYTGGKSAGHIRRAVERANRLNADILLLGGDYITGGEELLDGAFSLLSGLESKYGIYSVIGNHEWPYKKRYITQAAKHGIIPVDERGSRVFIGTESIVISGSEFYLHKLPDISPLRICADEEDFVIYLQHNPDLAEVLDTDLIDLMLSGHNHGGQITLFGRLAPYMPSKYGQKYRTGMVWKDKYPVIVSNGIGVYKIPLRFGARPQIVLVHLKKTE